MNILIAGGAGFIGSHLIDKLIQRGQRVVAVDNFHTGSRKNIAHLESNDFFSLREHDIINPINITEPIDQIYHLACPAAPVHYQKDPLQTIRTAFDGTRNLLELARIKNASIIYVSTSEVYGDPLQHPQKESYWGNVNPIGDRSCYNEGKRAAEALCASYWKKYNLPAKIVRIFNTYGPRMAANDGRVIPNFITQALKGEPITIYGDGGQTRSFCYVDDTVSGLIALLAKPGFNGPVNIGNPEEISMRSLAENIIRLTSSSSQLSYQPLPQDDPRQRQPDISLAKSELGWEPKVGLEKGLLKTIEYFRTASKTTL